MSRFDTIDPADYRIPEADVARILSPALVIFLDKVRENLVTLFRYVDGDADRLRPHIKTSKVPHIFAEMVPAGVRNFKCATTREAEHLLTVLDAEGIVEGDLLVAYPHPEPALSVFDAMAKRHPNTKLSVLCEDPQPVRHIPEALTIWVDVNPGMNRTGVPFTDRATILAVAEAAGARFSGIHHYEGHIHSGSFGERSAHAFRLYEQLLTLLDELRGSGHDVREVVTSGTPSFRSALSYEPFQSLDGVRHRVSPGTVIYSDARYQDDLEELEFVPAAFVLSRVVSWLTVDSITVDAGSKALATEAGDPVVVVLGHPELQASGPSEEHLPFHVAGTRRPPAAHRCCCSPAMCAHRESGRGSRADRTRPAGRHRSGRLESPRRDRRSVCSTPLRNGSRHD